MVRLPEGSPDGPVDGMTMVLAPAHRQPIRNSHASGPTSSHLLRLLLAMRQLSYL